MFIIMQQCCIYFEKYIILAFYKALIMNIEEFLKSKGIKSTSIRTRLLEILDSSNYPVSYREIDASIGNDFDRVTLYRNLKFLSDKKIIHKIDVNETNTSYNITKEGKFIDHPHFYCQQCEKVICLPQNTIDKIYLPDGFEQKSQKFIINGTCNLCNTKS